MTDEFSAAIAQDFGPISVDSPIILGFEEGDDFVLFLEPELGGVDRSEREGSFVAGLEIEISREEVDGVQIQICAAFVAAVDGSHGRRDRVRTLRM